MNDTNRERGPFIPFLLHLLAERLRVLLFPLLLLVVEVPVLHVEIKLVLLLVFVRFAQLSFERRLEFLLLGLPFGIEREALFQTDRSSLVHLGLDLLLLLIALLETIHSPLDGGASALQNPTYRIFVRTVRVFVLEDPEQFEHS